MKLMHLTRSANLLTILLALAIVVLLLPASALAGQTDQAQALLDKAQAKWDEQSKVDAQAGKLLERALQAKTDAKALALLGQAEAACAKLTENVQAQAALYGEVAALEVSPELKTFALQRQAIAQQYEASYGLLADLAAKYRTATKWESLSKAERKALREDITAIGTRLQEQWTQIQADNQASVQYYDDHKLADQLASAQPVTVATLEEAGLNTGVLIAGLVVGLVVAVAFSVACGLIARRKNRSVFGWAALGFFFPLLGLILILVLSAKRSDTSAVSPPQAPVTPV